MFRVLKTAAFDEECARLDGRERLQVSKILKALREKGGSVGGPLCGLTFFREKRFGGKRLYFLVYDDVCIVLVLGMSDKKAQQATINEVILHLDEYKEYIAKVTRASTQSRDRV